MTHPSPDDAARLEAALKNLIHAIDRLPTVQDQHDMAGWWAKTKVHVANARALLPPPPTPEER